MLLVVEHVEAVQQHERLLILLEDLGSVLRSVVRDIVIVLLRQTLQLADCADDYFQVTDLHLGISGFCAIQLEGLCQNFLN